MKLKRILPICLALAMIGCSSDDETTTPPEESNSNYFPLTVGNSWTYNNERAVDQQPSTQSQETMTVADSSEENGNTYYELDTDNSLEGGLVTNILSNGKLTKINGELMYTGNYEVEIPNFDPLQLPIEATIYSKTASAGTELTNVSQTIQEEIDVQGQLVPVSLDYNIVTTNEGFLPSVTINGEEFQDVLQANLVVSASITAALGPIEVTLLAEQEVVTVTNYYADGVGLIHSEATINYEFEDLSNYGVPTIPNLHIESSQKVDSYNVIAE